MRGCRNGSSGSSSSSRNTGGTNPGIDPPPPRPREVRQCSTRPGAEAVRQHNPTHCPFQCWCEMCVASKGRSDHYHKEAQETKDGDVPRVQMVFMFVGAEGSFVDEPRAKATVLMVMTATWLQQWCVRRLTSMALSWCFAS